MAKKKKERGKSPVWEGGRVGERDGVRTCFVKNKN